MPEQWEASYVLHSRAQRQHSHVSGRRTGEPAAGDMKVRSRYRAPLVDVTSATKIDDNIWTLDLEDDIRAVTSGQSAVIYRGDQVLGGGIVI